MRIEYDSSFFGLILRSIKSTTNQSQNYKFHRQLWELSYSYLSYKALALYDIKLLQDSVEWRSSGERAWTAIVRAKVAMDSFASVLEIIDQKAAVNRLPSVAHVDYKNPEFQRAIDWIRNPHDGANQSYIFLDNWYPRLVHCRDRLIHRGYVVYTISNTGCMVTRAMKPNVDFDTTASMGSFDHIDYSTVEHGLKERMSALERQLEIHVREHTEWNIDGDCRVIFDDTGADCDATSVCYLPTIQLDGLTAAIDHFET